MKKLILALAIHLSLSAYAMSSELVYTPINPSFGGSALNGSFLLSKAQAQNKHKAEQSKKSFEEKVSDAIERATISDIVSQYKDTVLGESAVFNNEGDTTFFSGDYQIDILSANSDSITIEITDLLTGKITIIEIPKFG
ncbi:MULTISPECIES: curli assembly protein CsgF [unclassified Colwellia]|jgi:curli production assembly/transport component CsgF|uniref:curli assembly protein CsgF n=1 Tax=unclassified Colwellia TaxID=196834 RepID=UPI0015F39866|nr:MULTISPECIES: curli assembly protein CsgF [unclassified Colwellia]MBA6365272.1 curli production assembly protein CsgF [Colwellia sp. BRX8-8]MBA6337644.1 curli production assembly protein CsgF [Colwellia sp. BRX8-7]MBA6353203.1 curli production assembly protein CsgF [Colwellia sp. BRX9-1]MBA6372469.1 curli production assembly protein CsgF [Colwellia sp. BRX8-4]MBA6379653.1 curli production assembly protein CsgF [Colwellia sp. BRX10-7]|tara:strand:- start:156 stop:572 length:417 start_codon:yes stop_codon:yes gene_type:complete